MKHFNVTYFIWNVGSIYSLLLINTFIWKLEAKTLFLSIFRNAENTCTLEIQVRLIWPGRLEWRLAWLQFNTGVTQNPRQQACPGMCVTLKCPLETLLLCCGLFALRFSKVLCCGLCSVFFECVVLWSLQRVFLICYVVVFAVRFSNVLWSLQCIF